MANGAPKTIAETIRLSRTLASLATLVFAITTVIQIDARAAADNVSKVSYYSVSANPDALWATEWSTEKRTRLEAGPFSQLLTGQDGYCAVSGLDTISIYRFKNHIATLKRANPDVVSWWGSRLLYRSGLQTFLWDAASGHDAPSPVKLTSELDLLLPWSDGCMSLEERNGQTVIKTFNKAGKASGSWKTYGAFQTGRLAAVNHQYIVTELVDDRKITFHVLWIIDTLSGRTQTVQTGSGTLGFCGDTSQHTLIIADPIGMSNVSQASATYFDTMDLDSLRRTTLFHVTGQLSLIGMSQDNGSLIAIRSLGPTVPGSLVALRVTTQKSRYCKSPSHCAD